MELYKKHRPKSLGQIIGQEVAVTTLEAAIEENNIPHFIMFTGPRGCGKTTLARIMRRKLKCSKYDFVEIAPRKVEAVREIKSKINLAAVKGKCRIFLIDECFVAGTLINIPIPFRSTPMPYECKPIQDLRPGDSIFSATGIDKVLNVFTKKIPLSRLMKIIVSDGRILYCSDSHEFYTNRGWVKAKNLLKKDLIFSFVRNIMRENLLKGNKYENQSMSRMQETDAKVHKGKKNTNILQQKLCNCFSLSKIRKALHYLWKAYNPISETQGEIQQKVLQSKLCSERQNKTRINSQSIIQCQNEAKNKSEEDRILPNKKGKRRGKKKFSKNDKKQSNEQSQNYKKDDRNQKKKWNSPSMERKKRGQWSIYNSTEKITEFIRRQLANGISYIDQTKVFLSLQLQSRYRKREIKDCNRNRWEGASYEKEYAERCKETKPSSIIRVESIEIYKRGCNEQSFEGIIEDRELRRNYITLYDIEVENHPSYFANGILVHNCHKLTSDAQDEFLKMLEDGCPNHVYFLFTTTDPQKMKSTIKDRCTEIVVKPLNEKNLTKLIKYVCKEERTKIPEDVIEKIVDNSDGSARKALVFLNGVINLKTKSEQLNAIVTATAETQAIMIARALFNSKTTWKTMARILKETEGEEAEQIRWMILGYAKTIILSGGKLSGRAYIVIGAFEDNFYDNKWAGLAAACYEIVEGAG